MEENNSLDPLRKKIRELDGNILELLSARSNLALEIGSIKKQLNKPVYAPDIEEKKLKELIDKNKGPLREIDIRHIFGEIISSARALEQPLRIAYFGPEASFTHLASKEHFGNSQSFLPVHTIEEVFDAVDRGIAEFGVVPIENSTDGHVSITLDCLIMFKNILIIGEEQLKISHCLASLSKKLSDIRIVYSHMQAAAQCRGWLNKHMPNAQLLLASSTAEAARISSSQTDAAAIASEEAANHYGLDILAKAIEDNSRNITRFLIIGSMNIPSTGRDRTSIVFTSQHVPGSLYKAIGCLDPQNINMTSIHSRPLKDRHWEYGFFIDFEGHIDNPRISDAVARLEKKVNWFKWLGSYPICGKQLKNN